MTSTSRRISGITCFLGVVALLGGCAADQRWGHDARPGAEAQIAANDLELRRVEARPIELLATDSLGRRMHHHERRVNDVDE